MDKVQRLVALGELRAFCHLTKVLCENGSCEYTSLCQVNSHRFLIWRLLF